MATSNMSYLNVNPAVQDRKASIALLDTAEELVDSLDNLSVCLKQIEDKYLQVRIFMRRLLVHIVWFALTTQKENWLTG